MNDWIDRGKQLFIDVGANAVEIESVGAFFANAREMGIDVKALFEGILEIPSHRFEHYLRENQLSADDAAALLGRTRRTIDRYRSGEAKVPALVAWQVLGIELELRKRLVEQIAILANEARHLSDPETFDDGVTEPHDESRSRTEDGLAMEAKQLRAKATQLNKVLTKYGSGNSSTVFDYIAILGAEGDVIAADEKLTATKVGLIEPYQTLFGKGFIRLLAEVFLGQIEHARTTALEPVGNLRAVIFSFEKQVFCCRVFQNERESVVFVGVTKDERNFFYRPARQLWDNLITEINAL